ncbi:MAG: restriction endonuclease subunit S [Desulfobulbus sp.]|nr:restriction endonuclease subunit S [Desulfobulbus sp.]
MKHTMINQDNFIKLLESLSFNKNKSVYNKTIGSTSLMVDVSKKAIYYPEADGLIVNERQTCNFSANENFVVFECVHRLLEKGYKPEHIELEPKWKLGHGASGGRADILVKDNFGKPLLIIECKTAGSEFKKSWSKTLQDGDQLFSYAQQISETQFLCLYTSDFENDDPTYQSHIIAHRDNDQYLVANPLFYTFRKVTDVKERFAVWRDTYKLDYTTKGIFEDNIQPYQIGKDKYSLADLHAISALDQQKKYHEFATILRQHNVSGRENAFDKLVNLFLCKLVDEIENPDDLKFYWKGVAYDSHFDLIDRLQQLYQSGMDKFLGEDITYINQDDVNNALRFIRQNPDATQRAVWNLFIQQKFFTNNDFSFIDVHNERLFYQNADVLLKILQMWQDIRLTNTSGHNQFLGDMFEGFLDQGVKQSEGQFFTPMPICRFILMSLPLESLILSNPNPPMSIDYACGAGHFLTELALQIQPLLEEHKPQANPAEYHKAMIGIEKEYRLSKVAKVSAFMYGQQGIQICYGDGLVCSHEAFPDIRDGQFDLLVANPPYSVRGFLETLPEEERKAYSLTNTINDVETANSIEPFFIERAKQLLKAGGVAAIILPSSILSNGGGTYIRAREILLQYFDIIAIAEFGSGTFGKTGTNTVTLFLRRKSTQPDTAEHYCERVEEWFMGCAASKRKQVIYKDGHLIEQYCTHINVSLADYQSLLRGEVDGSWKQQEHFQTYHDKFDKSTELVNLRKQKKFRTLSKVEQTAEIGKRYLSYAQAIERDKLYHYVMASDQVNPVLIIRSPSSTKEIKQFLGYDWSAAKGDEGIKLIEDAKGQHVTALYDGPDRANPTRYTRNNPAKLNHHIAANFDGTLGAIPEELIAVASPVRLVDMLDFTQVVFEKQLRLLSTNQKSILSSKWPMVKLSTVTKILNGGTPDTKNPSYWENGDICWATLVDTKQKYLTDTQRKITKEGLKSTTLLPINTVIFSSRATIGEVCINLVPTATNQGYKNFVCDSEKLNYEYLYHLLVHLKPVLVDLVPSGSKYKEINSKTIANFEIPLPPLNDQEKLSKECNLVDAETEKNTSTITQTNNDIKELIEDIYASKAPHLEIAKLSLNIQYGLNEKMNEAGFGYKIFRMNEIIQGRMVDNGAMKCADISAEEFAKYRLNKGDLLFNRTNSIEHVGKTGMFALEGDYCFASYLVRVVPDTSKVLPLFLVKMMNSSYFQKEAKGKASKSINQSNINATVMKNIKVPVPTLTEQQKFVTKIEALEQQIAEAQAIINIAPARKEAVMKKYL